MGAGLGASMVFEPAMVGAASEIGDSLRLGRAAASVAGVGIAGDDAGTTGATWAAGAGCGVSSGEGAGVGSVGGVAGAGTGRVVGDAATATAGGRGAARAPTAAGMSAAAGADFTSVWTGDGKVPLATARQ
jgi:hypothetical protein